MQTIMLRPVPTALEKGRSFARTGRPAEPACLGRLTPHGRAGEIRRITPETYRPVRHSHGDAELNLVVRGSGALRLSEARHDLRPGVLAWIPSEGLHELVRAPQLEIWAVIFDPDLLDPSVWDDLARDPVRQLPDEEAIALDRLFADIAQDSDDPNTYNPGITYAVNRALRAREERPCTGLKPLHPAVARALQLLRQERGGESLTSLAAASGIAPHYLSHLLTAQTGRTYVEWRNRIRLERFMTLYRPGDSLLHAALGAGFGSYNRFHCAFTEVVGCTPKAWVAQGARRYATAAMEEGRQIGSAAFPSGRQRWAAMTPLASPALTEALGAGFLARVMQARATVAAIDDSLGGLSGPPTAEDVARLVASLAERDPVLAAEYGRLLERCDIASSFARTLLHYEMPPGWRFADALAALVCGVCGALSRTPVGAAHVAAVSAQVGAALSRGPRDARLTRDAHVAAVCHLVILREVSIAARAAGDPRARDQIAALLRVWSEEVFGGDLSACTLTDTGLASKAPALSAATSRPLRRRAA